MNKNLELIKLLQYKKNKYQFKLQYAGNNSKKDIYKKKIEYYHDEIQTKTNAILEQLNNLGKSIDDINAMMNDTLSKMDANLIKRQCSTKEKIHEQSQPTIFKPIEKIQKIPETFKPLEKPEEILEKISRIDSSLNAIANGLKSDKFGNTLKIFGGIIKQLELMKQDISKKQEYDMIIDNLVKKIKRTPEEYSKYKTAIDIGLKLLPVDISNDIKLNLSK